MVISVNERSSRDDHRQVVYVTWLALFGNAARRVPCLFEDAYSFSDETPSDAEIVRL